MSLIPAGHLQPARGVGVGGGGGELQEKLRGRELDNYIWTVPNPGHRTIYMSKHDFLKNIFQQIKSFFNIRNIFLKIKNHFIMHYF